MAKFCNTFTDKTFRQSWKISAVFGAKKQETFSDFLSWYAAVTGGGYSVVIPRKQTCSPYLKRFLCKWACGCPALFFSVGCKSHLQRLTGSFHFPCSKRLQIFVSRVRTMPGLEARYTRVLYSRRVRFISSPS